MGFEINRIDSIIAAIEGKNDLQKIEILLELCNNESNAERATAYAEAALQLARILEIPRLKGEAFLSSGREWKNWGDYLKSIEQLKKALEIFNTLQDRHAVARVKLQLGETYRASKRYDLSVKALHDALDYFLEKGDTLYLAKTYNRLAANSYEVLFINQSGYNPLYFSESDYTELDEIIKRYPKTFAEADSIWAYISKAKKLAGAIKNHELLIKTDIIAASSFMYSGEMQRALEKYDSIISDIHKHELYLELPLVYLNKSRLYNSDLLNIPDSAIALAFKALDLAKQENIKVYEFMAYQLLRANFLEKRDYKKAYLYLELMLDIQEQFNTNALKLKINTERYNYELKERENAFESSKQQLFWILLFFIIFLAASFTFVFILIRKNKRLKMLLNELNEKNTIISEQNQKLSRINTEKDKFFSIIAHDLKSPFASIIGLSELQLDHIKKEDYKDVSLYAELIKQSANKSMSLLINLKTWARSQTGAMGYKPEELNLKELVDENLKLYSENASQKLIELEENISEEQKVIADKDMLSTILRNLIGNSIKFTFPGGKVKIACEDKPEEIVISVSDSGIGIPKEIAANLFKLDKNVGRTGTNGEPSSGLGLLLCSEFTEKHGGKIRVESQEDKGSTFYISLPKH
jgi:two-component system, sensor histidine kinase and response regulator